MIPCHRVVGTKGNLTGYAGGIDKKLWLLEMEKADMTAFFVPAKEQHYGIGNRTFNNIIKIKE